jgi:4-hydroxybenzoyl-CoA thioesterase
MPGTRPGMTEESPENPSMLTNSRNLRIVWGDCDPAGIVFYPRYFEIFDASTTMLFERALGMTKYEFTRRFDAVGYPMVDTRARFLLPNKFGDDVVVETEVAEFRRSSFDVRHCILRAGELTVEGFETRVWAVRDPDDASRIRAQAVPREILDAFERG